LDDLQFLDLWDCRLQSTARYRVSAHLADGISMQVVRSSLLVLESVEYFRCKMGVVVVRRRPAQSRFIQKSIRTKSLFGHEELFMTRASMGEET